MKYIEFYNMNNILEYRIKVEEYQVGDVGMNMFTDGIDIDWELFYKNPKNAFDELNNKISYDLNYCRGEEFFKMKLIDTEENIAVVADKVLLGMVENNSLFFQPLIEHRNGKTMSRYYVSFVGCVPRIEYVL